MKALLLLVTALSAPTLAQASFYQEFCSNGEATTRHANGHNDNYTEVTERFWTNDGPTDVKIRNENLEMKVISEKEISQKKQESCGSDNYGWYSISTATAKEVTITNADGSLFSDRVLGVSKDRKSVEAVIVCQMEVSGEMPCEGGK